MEENDVLDGSGMMNRDDVPISWSGKPVDGELLSQ